MISIMSNSWWGFWISGFEPPWTQQVRTKSLCTRSEILGSFGSTSLPCPGVFDVHTHKIRVCAAHGRALPGVGTAQSKSPGSALCFLFVSASCVQRDGSFWANRAVCHPSLFNNSQCLLLSETFQVQAVLRGARGLSWSRQLLEQRLILEWNYNPTKVQLGVQQLFASKQPP